MKTQFSSIILFALLLLMVPGCQVIGDIFKAGVWVGILAVVGVIVLIFWLIGKARK